MNPFKLFVLNVFERAYEDLFKINYRKIKKNGSQSQHFHEVLKTFQILKIIKKMKVVGISLFALVVLAQLTCSLRLHLAAAVNSAIPQSELLRYINEARTNPSAFAQYVRNEMAQFIDNRSLPLYTGMTYSTNEGIGAWKEAQNFLLIQTPLPPMQLNEGLSLAAEDHAIDMAVTGIQGHDGSDGKTFMDRIIRRCGKSYGGAGQNIGSEFKILGRNHALQTIMGLIIDDGVPSRGHRANIFSTSFKYVGIAARVQRDKILTVFDFHTNNLPTINSTSNTNNVGAVIDYNSTQSAPATSSNTTESSPTSTDQTSTTGSTTTAKYPVSTSTSIRSSTVDGKITTVKTVTTLYSDGSQDVTVTTTTS